MKERIEKIKVHLKENKTVYLTGAGCFVVGAATAVVALARKDSLVGDQKIVQALSWKPEATQRIEVWIEALGDPGNIIQDTTTGSIYASQGQAARELDLSAPAISKHLKGITPHVKGHTFEVLGKAAVA